MKDRLERHQVPIYLACVLIAAAAGLGSPPAAALADGVNPALALMLFVTFLQVPLADIGSAFRNRRFIAALLAANFVAIPVLVFGLLQLAPEDPLVRLGILMVLLTPCIDYVITFSQLGRADARLLLAATPLLLVAQMVLLPAYLAVFIGTDAAALVEPGPFIRAFAWLIVGPLVLAGVVQVLAPRSAAGRRVAGALGVLPVPATALVLFLVVVSTVPLLGSAADRAAGALPVYLLFAVAAPAIGWMVAKGAGLGAAAGRAVAFSSATRNSLVILPLALSVPGGMPVLPAVIVAQTLVELVAELVYIRVGPRLGRNAEAPIRPAG